MKTLDIYGTCPKCGMSWDGGDIPEAQRQFYSAPFKWSRLIGIEVQERYDGVLYWQCPRCSTKFQRHAWYDPNAPTAR